MRARYYSPHYARFLRIDPLRGDPSRPQSLNRYAYTMANPMTLTDPTGKAVAGFCGGVASGPCEDDSSAIQVWESWLSDLPNVGEIRWFDADQVHEALLWMIDQMRENPGDFHISLGYSRGGYSGINLANQLVGFGYLVDLLLTVDPFRPSGDPRPVLPNLAGRAHNWIQDGSSFNGKVVIGARNYHLGDVGHGQAPAAASEAACEIATLDAAIKAKELQDPPFEDVDDDGNVNLWYTVLGDGHACFMGVCSTVTVSGVVTQVTQDE